MSSKTLRPKSPDRAIVAAPGMAIAAAGTSLVLRERGGSGPPWLHAHRADDAAWHVLEGALRFRFADGERDAPAGSSVFVPAGVAHTYRELAPSRYLLFLTPRLDRLFAELQQLGDPDPALLRKTLARYATDLVE